MVTHFCFNTTYNVDRVCLHRLFSFPQALRPYSCKKLLPVTVPSVSEKDPGSSAWYTHVLYDEFYAQNMDTQWWVIFQNIKKICIDNRVQAFGWKANGFSVLRNLCLYYSIFRSYSLVSGANWIDFFRCLGSFF